ncbi:tonB-dependent Receptor Plug domain protein, partial [Vibrio parahaemolyticus AQ3810]
KGY